MLQGLSVFLCLFFSFESYGLYWDLRYVPLVLAFLYGGPLAGGIVLIAYMAARTFIGGDALLFGYISGVIASIIPALFVDKFWTYMPSKRIKIAVLIGIWPAVGMCGILLAFIFFQGSSGIEIGTIMTNIFLFGVIQVLGIGCAAYLHESAIERQLMRKEILRAEKLNTLGELAASIAHEVRNPLTVVKGFLQLMQKQASGTNEYYFSLVLSELGRAESIINDYLNFAKPQFEKVEKVNLMDLVLEVYLLLKPLGLKEGSRVENQLEHGAFVVTDRNQLKQAFVNIIKNAIEATSEGGTVQIKLEIKGNQAIIIVADTGKGMNEEQLARIGTLFYTTKDKGTGLGTSVSLKIIEAIGGDISYKSELIWEP